MAVQASAKVYFAVSAVLSNPLDLLTPEAVLRADLTPIEFDSGTGEYQINKWFCDERSLSASGTEDLDFAGGVTDALGNTVTMTAIKIIMVWAIADNTNDVVVGGDTTDTLLGVFSAEAGAMNCRPGGFVGWCAPKTGATVTATTGDQLMVTNGSSGTSVTYRIFVGGIG